LDAKGGEAYVRTEECLRAIEWFESTGKVLTYERAYMKKLHEGVQRGLSWRGTGFMGERIFRKEEKNSESRA